MPLRILPFKPPAFIGVKAARVEYPGDFVRMDDGVEVYRITDWELAPGATKASVTNSPSYGIVFGNPTYDAATIWDDVEKSAMSAVDMRLAADLVEETIALFE